MGKLTAPIFTLKQREVIQLLAQDLFVPEIATRLSLSTPGVHTRIKHAKQIAEVRTAHGLVAFAIRHGEISP